ncbi:MAG: hypothetical protein HYS98_03215 [Deltaproteobacteria bacterium]|nr:hypothetical protein [Deltaproteobacteria bacterium]
MVSNKILKIHKFISLLVATLFLHCGAPEFIAPKQKEKPLPAPVSPHYEPDNPPLLEPPATSLPQLWLDGFIHEVPQGNLDIAFILHAKKKMSPFIQALKESSHLLLASLMDPPEYHHLRPKLSFKLRLITSHDSTPWGEDIFANNAFTVSGLNKLSETLGALNFTGGEASNFPLEKLVTLMKSGFLREGNTHFFPIFISNADDEGTTPVDHIVASMQTLKSKALFQPIALIFKEGSDQCNNLEYRRATTLAEFVSQTSGISLELCDLLQDSKQVINKIIQILFEHMTRKVLTYAAQRGSIEVYLNGLKANPSEWHYNESTQELFFLKRSHVAAGDQVDIRYHILLP